MRYHNYSLGEILIFTVIFRCDISFGMLGVGGRE